MSTEAFGSRRVTESLRAIAKYLDDGARIAGGVPPGQVVRLDLEPTPGTPSPRLTNVLWEDNHSHVIKVGPGQTTLNVLVSGDNLDTARIFKLVGATSGSTYFETTDISNKAKTGFTARITLIDPSPVSYHAFVVNKARGTFLLERACAIERPAETEPEPGLQLGGVMPNEGAPGDTVEAILLLLRGTSSDVSEVYVTDRQGTRTEWTVDIEAPQKRRGSKQKYQGTEQVFLRITIPQDEESGVFHLVAESTALNSEDRLAFYVRPSSQSR